MRRRLIINLGDKQEADPYLIETILNDIKKGYTTGFYPDWYIEEYEEENE